MKRRGVFALLALTVLAGALAGCFPNQWLLPKLGIENPVFRDFGPGFQPPLSYETNQPVTGFGGNGGGVHRTPLILVHGTTMTPSSWNDVRDYFRGLGYTDDELWAVGYGWSNGHYLDSAAMSAVTLDRFVNSVLKYLSDKTGRPIRQVDMIGHSLGVSVVRQWVKQANGFHELRRFIAACGVNHGAPSVTPDGRGPNREVTYSLSPDAPWLQALNRGGEAPGPTHFMTMYDGTGWGDIFFPPPFEESPRLEGAYNLAYNREHKTLLDHMDLMMKHVSLDAMSEWLMRPGEPLPAAEPPRIVREGAVLKADQPDTQLHCASGENYPGADAAGVEQLDLTDGALHTCFPRNDRTGWAGRLERFKGATVAPAAEPLTLTATPAGGVYEQPQVVQLAASDPGAFIVYSVVTTAVDSGSALYLPAIGVPVTSPLVLTARAYAPDGRVSETLSLKYDISVEMIDANHTLERQIDPDAPLKYEGRRHVGR